MKCGIRNNEWMRNVMTMLEVVASTCKIVHKGALALDC